jgi:predicted HAD superfamily Cof-like phosphohydrolase
MSSADTQFEDLAELHDKMGFPRDGRLMTAEFLDFRLKFMLEELIEMDAAIESKDAPAFVDAVIDLIVVAVGTLDLADVNGQKAWDEVHIKNMQKECRVNPTRTGSGGFDMVKPAGWEPPDHSDNVGCVPTALNGRRAMPHSITVLLEAISLQLRKDADYSDNVERGEYWIHGMDSLEYELNKKHLRFRSVLGKLRRGVIPNFESVEDSLFDKIVYSALAVSFMRKKEPGQQMNLFGPAEVE